MLKFPAGVAAAMSVLGDFTHPAEILALPTGDQVHDILDSGDSKAFEKCMFRWTPDWPEKAK
jgi:hypothetical protein